MNKDILAQKPWLGWVLVGAAVVLVILIVGGESVLLDFFRGGATVDEADIDVNAAPPPIVCVRSGDPTIALNGAVTFQVNTADGADPTTDPEQRPLRWFAPDGTPATGTGRIFTTTYTSTGEKEVIVIHGYPEDEELSAIVPARTAKCTVTVL